MEIKDLAGLSEPLKRLVEVISEGVGAVSRPYLIRKTADAQAYEIRTVAEAMKDVANQHQLPVEYKDGTVEVWQKPEDGTLDLEPKSVDQRCSLRLGYQAHRHQQNIEQITAVAADEFVNEEFVPKEKPDQDWVARFFAYAQEISSEQMQNLWGRLLAGEVKRPGSYSLRTLEFVRNLTKSDAELLEHIGKYAISYENVSFVVQAPQGWMEDRGVYYQQLCVIIELGAMYPTQVMLRLFGNEAIHEQEQVLVSGDNILLLRPQDSSRICNLMVWKFTQIGHELLPLIVKPLDDDYFDLVGRMFMTMPNDRAYVGRVIARMPEGKPKFEIIREVSKVP